MRVQIFLPPSEGKTSPAAGATLDLTALSFPELNPTRQVLIDELKAVSARADALDILGVGPRVSDQVATQIELDSQPCAPACEIYTGVLYSALDFSALTAQQREHAARHVTIFSGLFGAVRPTDPIPAYRLGMGTKLPSGNTATVWRSTLSQFGPESSELIVDCRSGNYRVWSPPGSTVVTIRAVRVRNGKRAVVSHNAKHYRGLLAGRLLRAGEEFETPEELAEFADVLVASGEVTSIELEHTGREYQLTLVEDEDGAATNRAEPRGSRTRPR